jgi:hypothetical protein
VASRSNIKAGRAYVELGVTDRMSRGLMAAQAKLKAFAAGVRTMGTRLAGLGAAIVAPLAATTKVFADAGSEMLDMSKRTGVSVEGLSELTYAAQQTGASTEVLEAALRRMQRSVHDAGRGTRTAVDAFGALGLSVAEVAALAPEEQFKRIAERLDGIADPTRKAALAMELFGRSGTGLLPMIEGGRAGLDKLAAQARQLGLVMTGAEAESAHAYGDAMLDLSLAARRAAFVIGGALAPMMKDLAERTTRLVAQAAQWISQNRQLVVTTLQVGAAIAAAGVALIGASYVLGGLAAGLKLAATAVAAFGTAVAAAKALLVALATPIGLVAAASGAMAGYLVYASGVGGKALGWLGQRFGDLGDDAHVAFTAIGEAMAAGDISAAAKLLWMTLKMEWVRGTTALAEVWEQFRFGLRAGHEILVAELTKVWLGLWTELRRMQTGFTNWHQKATLTVAGHLAKIMIRMKLPEEQAAYAEREKDRIVAGESARIDAEAARESAAIEQQHADAMALADTEHQERMAQIARESKERTDSLAEDLRQARREWEEAVRPPAGRTARDAGAPEALEGPDGLEKVKAALVGLDVGNVARGTFSGAALSQYAGGGQVAERTARASEQTAKNTALFAVEIARLTALLNRGQ